jgi:GTPase SAR1 family protein
MDPFSNPFTPGAGAPPPELAGRDDIIEAAKITLARIRGGRAEKSQVLLGLRGVGKTVLLNRLLREAKQTGYMTVWIEAPEGERLATFLAPALKSVLVRLSKVARAKEAVATATGALRGFASAFKVSVGEFEFGVMEPKTADSGNIEVDLPDLLVATGLAAQAGDTSVAIFLDEVQYVPERDLRGLIVALHRVAQEGLPLVLFGAGLPQVAALAGEAKSYAERLFDFPEVGSLGASAAARAVREPITEQGVRIGADALERLVEVTRGYPYFLQEWGKHVWNTARTSPITAADVDAASITVTHALDRNFFRVRFDRLTPREQDYLRAMASLGPGPHQSGSVADALGTVSERMGPIRAGLIRKGMIYSPKHGETAFTVPMFDEFMRRAIPTWTPPAPDGLKTRRSRRG